MSKVVIKPGTVIKGLEDHDPCTLLHGTPITVKDIAAFSADEMGGWVMQVKDTSGMFWDVDNNDVELLEIINK